jgi:hypothetical protein
METLGDVGILGANAYFWPATGYFVLPGSGPDDKLIVDAKTMGPDHLPAHGHCSLFSYELSIAGERLIVDSGVEEYEPGPWRDFWRSTRAHNTVVVDGAERSEIWAAFRVGQMTRLLDSSFLQQPSSALFVGMHRGFVGQKIPTPHRRFIIALMLRRWIVIDEVLGTGTHTLESFIHFAPGVDCRVEDGVVSLRSASCDMRLYPLFENSSTGAGVKCVKGQTEPIQGWYAPEFGKTFPNPVVELSLSSTLPARVAYLIAPAGQRCESWRFQIAESSASVRIEIAIDSANGTAVEHFDLKSLASFPALRGNSPAPFH